MEGFEDLPQLLINISPGYDMVLVLREVVVKIFR